MTYYSLELAKFKNDKLEVMEGLMNGAFSINRTENLLAGVPFDKALEQTINAQAKSRLKEIMAYFDINSG